MAAKKGIKKTTSPKVPVKKAPGKKAEVKAAREQLLKELFEPKTEQSVEESPMEQKKQEEKETTQLQPTQPSPVEEVQVPSAPAAVDTSPAQSQEAPVPIPVVTEVENTQESVVSPEPVVHDETPDSEPGQITDTQKAHAEAFEGDPNQEQDDNKKKWLLNMLIILFGAVLIVLLYFYLQSLRLGQPPQSAVVPTVSEAPETPTVTPKSAALTVKDLAKYPIEILNGSGIRGEAAKVQEQLEAQDFVVSDIGNADASTYEETLIQYGSDVPKAYVDMLKKELEKIYVVKVEELDEESDAVTVVVGSLTSDSKTDVDADVTPTKAAAKKATPTPEE